MIKPHRESVAHSLLKFFIAIGATFLAFLLILALLIGFFALLFFELPLDITDEARLTRHFERNQEALEAVVEEVLAADVRSARRATRSIVGGFPRRPEGEMYEPLFKAMRRAKVQEVWVRWRDQPKVILITGTKPDMLAPDIEYFGYSWSFSTQRAVRRLDVHEEDMQLAPNWSLFQFFDG